MEFKEFCKELDRMCKTVKDADDCKLYPKVHECMNCGNHVVAYPDEAEKIVSEWAKEHPAVTNRKKFKEVFGFNIMTEPEEGHNFTMSTEVLLERVEKWLQQEYKPPRKENTDESQSNRKHSAGD